MFFFLFQPPRVGLEPTCNITEVTVDKALMASEEPVLSTSLDILLQKHPELKQIVSVWPELPDHIKQTIKTLVGSVIGRINQEENK